MSGTVKWLEDWFEQNGSSVPGLTDNYFETGSIDSMSVIGLITDIEEHSSMHFTQEHFQDRRFSTISGLAQLVDEIIEEK